MIKNNIFLQKATQLPLKLKVWCTGTLKYIGYTVEFAYQNTLPHRGVYKSGVRILSICSI